MKTGFFVLSLFFLLSFSVLTSAQQFYFCEDVDEDGFPQRELTSLNTGDGCKCLVRLQNDCESKWMNFIVWDVLSDGTETYDNTITMLTETNWIWFWKAIDFKIPGKYKIRVYDDENNLIVTSGVISVRD